MRILAGLILLLNLAGPASAAELTGRASVIDGDTMEVGGERVRLHGIDAPESGQWCLDGAGQGYRCGQQTAFALAERIGARNVRCDLLDRDQYGRHVGRCFLVEADLNGWMVRQGQAVAYRRFSTEYVPAEKAARRDEIGIGQGDFDPPWDWRLGDGRMLRAARSPIRRPATPAVPSRGTSPAPASASSTCPVSSIMIARPSTRAVASAGSARRRRHKRPGGDGRCGDQPPPLMYY